MLDATTQRNHPGNILSVGPVCSVGLQAAMWVLFLFCLVMYVYAVLGRELFTDDDLKAKMAERFPATDVDVYFGSIPRSIVTLLQVRI